MEHLTRNTNNDRIIYTLENIKKRNESIVGKEITNLVDKIVNVSTGILSSLASGSIISILKNEKKIELGIIATLVLFLFLLLAIWFICSKWLVPYFYSISTKKRIDINPENTMVSVKRFNTEIMQKIAEVTETVQVVRKTDDKECKILNFVISLYKYQEVVDFLYDTFVCNELPIRRAPKDGATELLRYCFNLYTVNTVLSICKYVGEEMQDILNVDEVVNDMSGKELFQKDLSVILEKLKEIKI